MRRVAIGASVMLPMVLLTASGDTSPRTSAPTVSAHITVPQGFVGTWYVHGGILTIRANGTGTQVFSVGGYGEKNTISFVARDHGQRLLGVIRHIRYANSSGAIANPDPADTQRVGDTFSLLRVSPHILRLSCVKSALPEIDQTDDNPNWCGPGLSQVPEADRQRCGVG
jgi:hypothetical protein